MTVEEIKKYLVETKKGSYLPIWVRLKIFHEQNKDFKYGIKTACIEANKDYITYGAYFTILLPDKLTVENLFYVEHTEPIKNNNIAKIKNKAQLGAIGKLLSLIGIGTEYAIEIKSDILAEDNSNNEIVKPKKEMNKTLIKDLIMMIQTLNDLYPEKKYSLEKISQEVLDKKAPENEEEALKIKEFIQNILDED